MKKIYNILAAAGLALASAACGSSEKAATETPADNMTEQKTDTSSVRVLVRTTDGDFTVLLYGDTPKHRDNFVKLVKEGYYDGTLFHRVIKDFMIQAGDPDSKTAVPGQALGAGGPDYKIDAEIVYPKHFHKRYALAAARQGDQVNPMKQSSGSQFYVVTGTKLTDAQIDGLGAQLKNKQMQDIFNRLALEHRDSIIAMQRAGDRAGLQELQERLIAQTEAEAAGADATAITPEMRKAYTETGGAPHLDGDYTVFGEVIDGFDTIDRIEGVKTDGRDRPAKDVRIVSMKIIS